MQSPPRNDRQGANCLIDAAAPFPSTARIIDIRGRAEYSQIHIPNAANQPLQSLLNAPAGQLIVYDNGRFRSDALQLCERLTRYGVRDFKVIDGGIAAWAQSSRAQGVLDVSRLSDTEASAALVAGNSAVVTLSGGFPSVLRGHGIGVSAANPSSSGRTIILAEPGTSHDQISARLARRNGQNTAFYWTGSPEQLANLISAHLAQDQRRRQGPMVNPNCPGL
ncbi:rhodanese-like domain-containing protein [Luteimonas sp. BDR2-5]|uniref:rhodanese-like domain-containing protein n=1 Tax=Proluteimonas luteida TaxID=2878685 RepID=UPI001E4001C3|nr:rhodanese-like domain-containing protein [Luteimonas sp. BDR2-5]